MRYYKLTATGGGPLPLPEHQYLKVGAIICVARESSPRPGAIWNAETNCWVSLTWSEVADPRGDA